MTKNREYGDRKAEKMVYLVGAGPGDPGLLTCKGKALLEECDAVIYDRLGTGELLEEVKEECEKIYVGKRAGYHYKKQEEINRILIETARRYKKVVRLKGGDPFVFGRGGEEVLALQEAKIPFMIVPGITSAVSVPELVGIPVTHRKDSRSFHVFTGHARKEEADSLEHIHPEEGSSVFLMGLSHLEQIKDKLLLEGMADSTPAAVISNGTMPSQKVVRATLGTIVSEVKAANLTSPAIIVVGANAKYEFVSEQIGALAGKKIGIVGTSVMRKKTKHCLEDKGARVYSLLRMQLKKTDKLLELRKELQQIEAYQWIAFTSQNAIHLFFEQMKLLQIDHRRLAGIRFAVVGSGTKDALERMGFLADYMPQEYTTKALAQGLSERIRPSEKLLLARAAKSSTRMLSILEQNRIDVTNLAIYDVVGKKTENWNYLEDMDVITFFSASGVEAFAAALGKDNVSGWECKRKKAHVKVAAIGHVTADKLRAYGIQTDCMPVQCDLAHMAEALEAAYQEAD